MKGETVKKVKELKSPKDQSSMLNDHAVMKHRVERTVATYPTTGALRKKAADYGILSKPKV